MVTGTAPLPSGRVTFAFIDVVGSTRTFLEHGDEYVAALRELHATVARHAHAHGGAVVETEGDGAFLAFPDAPSGMHSLLAPQSELGDPMSSGLHLQVRAGAHTGNATPVDGHYLALAVYVAARVAATANAGQVLVTDDVVDELAARNAALHELAVEVGTYSLKDLAEPTRIWRMAGSADPPRATPARRTNVQATRTSFHGREQELRDLRELVAEPGLTTVVGPGGAGKTRLVSELALQDAELFAGGAWLVELATLDAPDQIVPTVAGALGLSTSSRAALVTELVRRGRCLLILDNCEHLIGEVAELVDELVPACREATLLCTSREVLNLAGERVARIPGLPIEAAGVSLFLDRCQKSVEVVDRPLVQELCAQLDGLPLAIELAASQSLATPLSEVLRSIRSGADPLARRGGEERQRGLDGVLEWSLGRLDGSLRDSLLALSVFPGRFSPDMARGLLGAAPRCDPDAARRLSQASLIDLDGPDYRLLSTVRDAARRRLAGDTDLHGEALDALTTWTAAYGVERFAILTYHEDVPDDTVLAVEAGLAHGLDQGTPGLGLGWNLLSVIVPNRQPRSATFALCKRALETPVVDADSVWVVQAAHQILYLTSTATLEPERLASMLSIARAADDPRLVERVLFSFVSQADTDGDYAGALNYALEILVMAENREEVRHNLPAALNNVGYYAEQSGSLETAELYYERAATCSNEMGLETSHALARGNLAEILLVTDRPEEARDHALAALRIAPPGWAFRAATMSLLARAYAAVGDRAAAEAAGRESLEPLSHQAMHSPSARAELEALLTSIPSLRQP